MSRNLSVLSVASILEFLDLNKRVSLIIQFPRIRKIHKRVPLKISKLSVGMGMGLADIKIDDKVYVLSHDLEFDALELEELIRRENEEKIPFYRAFEEYKEGDQFNPLSPWTNSNLIDEYQLELDVKAVFEPKGIFCEYILNEVLFDVSYKLELPSRTVNDEYENARLYPKAFDLIHKQIDVEYEKMNRIRKDLALLPHHFSTDSVFSSEIIGHEYRLYFLKELAFPFGSIPESSKEYFQYPKSMIIGTGFWRNEKVDETFFSILFEGRSIVEVEHLGLDDYKDVALPVGHKFRAKTVKNRGNSPLMNFVESANHIVAVEIDGFKNLFDFPIVRNCEVLTLWFNADCQLFNVLQTLNNTFLCIGEFYSLEMMASLIDGWSRNSNRKLGSKLLIGIADYHPENFLIHIQTSMDFARLGFYTRGDELRRPMEDKELVLRMESDAEIYVQSPPDCPKIKRCVVVEFR